MLGKRKNYSSDDESYETGMPSHKRHKSMSSKPRAPRGYIYRDLEVVCPLPQNILDR